MDFSVLRRWWPVLAVAVLLAGASVAAAHSALGATRIPPAAENVPFIPEYPSTQPSPSYPVEPREAARDTEARVPGWVATAAAGLLGLAALLAFGYALWTVLRGAFRRSSRKLPARARRPSAEGAARDVVAALDAGLIELDDRSTDPRTVVIACWVRLEEAAATAGVPRRAGDTPTDLVTRLLRGDDDSGVPAIVSADVLAEFAHVYRQARYATHTVVDERTRDQARSALRRIRAELTVFGVEAPA
ncbi:DUF4129 domain-containing protein [Micromonospora sp. WMMD882]|uniref:DUF4129 domain-containing protein n=1 Tax=Micromonospora sp. WMMD882 TaxID=3015151 RepID=UPI00248AD02B|nr:DUF4129 domain-containing protein [Micromonospora sp. WMMD882]WBB77435.1 DUF4129 domain-containing protein [Micromonospora sp. WMMD882]